MEATNAAATGAASEVKSEKPRGNGTDGEIETVADWLAFNLDSGRGDKIKQI